MWGKYFSLLLIFVIACNPSLDTAPTSQRSVPVEIVPVAEDLCAAVSCPVGMICSAGNCMCSSGMKECDNACIDSDACCSNADCDSGTCEDGKCVIATECEFGEILKNGECRCAPDKIYCGEQDKCIDREDCCVHSQCNRFERCVPTNWRASLCVKFGEKKSCKVLADHERTEFFKINDVEYRAGAVEWWSDGSVTFMIENESVRIGENVTIPHLNASFFHEGIDVVGGFCKEDEEI